VFTHHLELVDLGYWIWKETKEIPDPRKIARMDRSWINDLMNYDWLVAYETTQAKKRTGQ
jgi:hypothetical protein